MIKKYSFHHLKKFQSSKNIVFFSAWKKIAIFITHSVNRVMRYNFSDI